MITELTLTFVIMAYLMVIIKLKYFKIKLQKLEKDNESLKMMIKINNNL